MFYKTVIHINLNILNLIFINMYLSILLFLSVVLLSSIEVINLNNVILPANVIFMLWCVIASLIIYGLRGRKTYEYDIGAFISVSVAFVFKLSGIFAIKIFGLFLLAPLFAALSVTIGYAVILGLEGKQSDCLSYLRVFVSAFVVYTFIVFIKYLICFQVDIYALWHLINIWTGWTYIFMSQGITADHINTILHSSTGSGAQGNITNTTQGNSSNPVQNNPSRPGSSNSDTSITSIGPIYPNNGYNLDRTMRIVNTFGNDPQAIDRYFSLKRASIINSYRIDSNNAAVSGATATELEGWLNRKNELLSLLADQKDDVKDLVE